MDDLCPLVECTASTVDQLPCLVCPHRPSSRRLQVNPEPLKVVPVLVCRGCGKRAPWCSCGAADYQ